MVVGTPNLNSLKRGLLAQLHQPMPLSQRESQHLLNSITSSFRKNLDKEHPLQSEDTPSPSTTTVAATTTEEDVPFYKARHRPTDRHLRAILSNPLFARPQQQKSSTSLIPPPTKNPFDVFDAAVAKGLMTTRRAAGFLATLRAQAAQGENPDTRPAPSNTGAGLRVLQWLRASGQENGLRFLTDLVLVKHLVPFLYAEGLEEVAWTWLEQPAARALEVESEVQKFQKQPILRLLKAMVEASSRSAPESKASLDGSYSALLRADQVLPKDHHLAALSIKNSWASLSWASTVQAFERPKPSAPLFESFVDLGRPFNYPLDLAHLELHHPTAPSSNSAVHYMHIRFDGAQDVNNLAFADRSRRRLICLALDAADRLKRAGNTTEASWVEKVLDKMCENLNLGMLNAHLADSLASERPLYRLN